MLKSCYVVIQHLSIKVFRLKFLLIHQERFRRYVNFPDLAWVSTVLCETETRRVSARIATCAERYRQSERRKMQNQEGKGPCGTTRSHETTIVAPTRQWIQVSGGARRPSQFPAVASHSRRFCGLASPLGKLDIARRKMARVTQYG